MSTLHRSNTLHKTKVQLIFFLIVLLALAALFAVGPVHAADARGGAHVAMAAA